MSEKNEERGAIHEGQIDHSAAEHRTRDNGNMAIIVWCIVERRVREGNKDGHNKDDRVRKGHL